MFDLQYWAQTPDGRDLIEVGIEKGVGRGLHEGRRLQAKRTIRLSIETHDSEFGPSIGTDEIETADQAHNSPDRLLAARTADEVRAILEARQ